MSAWDPHRDLVRLLAALSGEIVTTAELEVQAACFADGDSIHTAARDVRALIGTLIDEPDGPEARACLADAAHGPEFTVRQH